jgi:hypothetical protein
MCEGGGNICDLRITDFDIGKDEVKIGFFYPQLELSDGKFRAAQINFWETESVQSFDCGSFRKLSDINAVSQSYNFKIIQENLGLFMKDEKAIPCGLENAFFLLRDKIIGLSSSDANFQIFKNDSEDDVLSELSGLESNWIDDRFSYYKWIQFLSSSGQNYLEVGKINEKLPSSFTVSFSKGFGDLGTINASYLVFYTVKSVHLSAIGIAMIFVGCMTIALITSKAISTRKMAKF